MAHFKQKLSRLRLIQSAAASVLTLSAVAGGVVLASSNALAFEIGFNNGSLNAATYGALWNPPVDPAPPYGPPYGAPGFAGPLPGLLANPGPVPPAIQAPFTKQWYDTNFQFASQGQPSKLYFFPTDKQIWFVDNNTLAVPPISVTSGQGGPSQGSGNIEWTWQDTSLNGDWRIPPDPHSKDEWHVDVDFNPDLSAPYTVSTLDYVIRINDRSSAYPGIVPPPEEGNSRFEDVTLLVAANTPPGNIASVVDKEVYTAVWNSTLNDYTPGTLIHKLTVSGAGQDFYAFDKKYDLLYIKDTVNRNGSVIDNYTNIYRQVPGPLPILGVLSALGFKRKLRRLSSCNKNTLQT